METSAQNIDERIKAAGRTVRASAAVYHSKESELSDVRAHLETLRINAGELEEVNTYFSKLIADRREGMISKVLAFVTDGMRAVFNDSSIRVLLKDTTRSGNKYTKIGIDVNGIETWDWGAASGGIRQAVSFLFRVIFLSMSDNRRFIVLDEPFSALSAEYRLNMAELIRKLAKDMNMQFFIVTHQDEIRNAATDLFEIHKSSQDSTSAEIIKV